MPNVAGTTPLISEAAVPLAEAIFCLPTHRVPPMNLPSRGNGILSKLRKLFLNRNRSFWHRSKFCCLEITGAQKYSTRASFVLATLLQKANWGSSWRLSSEQVDRTECSFLCHVPGPRRILRASFVLVRHRLNVFKGACAFVKSEPGDQQGIRYSWFQYGLPVSTLLPCWAVTKRSYPLGGLLKKSVRGREQRERVPLFRYVYCTTDTVVLAWVGEYLSLFFTVRRIARSASRESSTGSFMHGCFLQLACILLP